MVRLINFLFILLLSFVAACDTSSNVDPSFRNTFIRYFGTDGDQAAADLVVNQDGTLIILGNSVSLTGEQKAFLLRTDIEGNVLWEKTVGGNNQVAVDLEPILDDANDKFVVALNEESGGTSRIKLLKVNLSGDTSNNVYLPLHLNGSRQVVRTVTSLKSTGEFVVTGYADRILVDETSPVNESNDQTDILAFRLDNSLKFVDKIVNKGGELNGCGIKAFELEGINEGKLALFSYTDRPFTADAFGFNFSFDIISAATPVGKLVGTEADQEFLAAALKVPFLNGGGFLMAGTARSTLSGPGDLYLVKYDDEFQQKALDVRLALQRNLECVSAENASSGYYILANEQSEGGLRDIALLKVAGTGGEEWTKIFGTREGDDVASAIAVLPDGRIAIVGTMELQTRRKVALIVLKSNGNF
jgi:hypothetical protein